MKETFDLKYLKLAALLVFVLFFAGINCGESNSKEKSVNKYAQSDSVKIPEGLKKLMQAYPEFIEKADENKLYWKDGTVMVYDDGKDKTFDEKLDNPDLEDMFSQKYTAGENWDVPPAENYDPGRIRYEPFFEKMYGGSQSEVKSGLVTISWTPSGTGLQVHSVNDVDGKLQQVADELDRMPSEFHKYFKKTAGTFNYRKIAGTDRLSTHSYGIAIDINTDYSDYWRWDKSVKYKNKIPIEIVKVFEKHGFIWGGKWYHYDTMHFEYRPELLIQ
ncbi:MAG: M15 family metallopeptidase [Ignavibacteria bacterium]|nr:M15 family metallopeptidase [Ignavibacteria bacterium]